MDEYWSEIKRIEDEGLKGASKELLKDHIVVSRAVERNGIDLKYADTELRSDILIIYMAVKNNGMALEFACDDAKNIPYIALLAVEQNNDACKYIGDRLLNEIGAKKDNVSDIVMKLKQNIIPIYNSPDNSVCAICQEPYSYPIITSCLHKFCHVCILNWMTESETCPICRTSITEDDLVNLDV